MNGMGIGLSTMIVVTVAGVGLLVIYPATSVYIISMIKIGTITFVVEKAVEVSGKKEMAEVIKLAGWSLCGVQILGLAKHVINNPPAWYKSLKTIDIGIGSIVDVIKGLGSGISKGVGVGN